MATAALAFLGRRPTPLAEFRLGIQQIQKYLAGEPVDLEGYSSEISWITASGQPKVPMAVAATGPRVIRIGAQVAERVTFAVGADVKRLRWAIELAHQAREESGQDVSTLSLGAYVNAVAHPDIARARELVRPRLSVYAQYSLSMHENARETLDPRDRAVIDRLSTGYGNISTVETKRLDDHFSL